MSTNNSDSPDPKDERVEGKEKEIEEFSQQLPGNFRWPKPNAEAVAAAVEAVQRMSGGSVTAQDLAAAAGGADERNADERNTDEPGSACSACGGPLAAGARFCAGCGTPTPAVMGDATAQSRAAPANITFIITITILSPVRERHPARLLPSPRPLLLAAALPVRRAVLRPMRAAAAPKPARDKLSRTGRRPATPGTLTICSNSTPPTPL